MAIRDESDSRDIVGCDVAGSIHGDIIGPPGESGEIGKGICRYSTNGSQPLWRRIIFLFYDTRWRIKCLQKRKHNENRK